MSNEIRLHRQELGRLLKIGREKIGLTQKDVAKRVGLSSAQFISNIERGLASPPIKMLRILIRIYRMKPNDIVTIMIDGSKAQLNRDLK